MDWTCAIEQLRQEGFFGDIILFHNGSSLVNGVSISYSELILLDDATQSDIKPPEQVLIDALSRWQIANATEVAKANERAGIIAKAALAVEFLPDLKLLLNAGVDIDIVNTDTGESAYATLITIMTNQISASFRNKFYGALNREQNIPLAGLNLDALLALSVNQKRIVLTYLRIFHNRYMTLALFGSLNS